MRTALARAWWAWVGLFDKDGTRSRNEFYERRMAAMNVALDRSCRELWKEANTAIDHWDRALHRNLGYDSDEPGRHWCPSMLDRWRDRGKVHLFQGDCARAGRIFEQELLHRKESFGKEHLETLRSATLMAKSLAGQRKHDEALALLLDAICTAFASVTLEHPDLLKSMSCLAELYAKQDRISDAEHYRNLVLKYRRNVLGWEHPKTLGSAIKLACCLSHQGRHAEAEKLVRYVLDIQRRVLGEAHPKTEDSADLLREVLLDQGKHVEAEQLMRGLLRVQGQVLGEEHADTRARARDLALSLAEHQGRYEDAVEILREIIRVNQELVEKSSTVDQRYTLGLKDYVGELLLAQGKHAEAERFFREVDPFRKVPWKPKLLLRQFGEEHTVTRVAATMLRDAAAEKSESEPKKVHCAYVLHLQIALFESLKADISSCASSGAAA
jgi:tetratricopeptide (TPR) repeat protein